jgi:hypothetical protein
VAPATTCLLASSSSIATIRPSALKAALPPLNLMGFAARNPSYETHLAVNAPGSMLVTDLENRRFALL